MNLWRRKRGRPIPGADEAIGWLKAPAPADPRVPGPAPGAGAALPPGAEPRTPARPVAPAPGHGGMDYTMSKDKCGRIRVWDGDGTLLYTRACGCLHVDLSDAAIERFISDARE